MTKEQRQYNGPKIVPSTNGAVASGHPHAKKKEKKKKNLDIDLPPSTRINSKQLIDLNIKCKTKKNF